MATKDCCLFLKDEKEFVNRNAFSNQDTQQYSNLNLNANQKFSSFNAFQTQSETTAASLKKIDHQKEHNISGKDQYCCNNLLKNFRSLNINDSQKIDMGNQWKKKDDSTKNGSTLSLHISAYENSVEASTNDSKNGENMQPSKKQSKVHKILENSNVFTNYFEIPRMQSSSEEEAAAQPEILHFKASQKLLDLEQENKKLGDKFKKLDKSNSRLKKNVTDLQVEVKELRETVATFGSLKQDIELLKKNNEKTSDAAKRLTARIDKTETLDTVSITKNRLRKAVTEDVEINGKSVNVGDFIEKEFMKTEKFAASLRDIEAFSMGAINCYLEKTENVGLAWSYAVSGLIRNDTFTKIPKKFVNDVVYTAFVGSGFAEDIKEWTVEEHEIYRGACLRVGVKLQSILSKRRKPATTKKPAAKRNRIMISDDEKDDQEDSAIQNGNDD